MSLKIFSYFSIQIQILWGTGKQIGKVVSQFKIQFEIFKKDTSFTKNVQYISCITIQLFLSNADHLSFLEDNFNLLLVGYVNTVCEQLKVWPNAGPSLTKSERIAIQKKYL